MTQWRRALRLIARGERTPAKGEAKGWFTRVPCDRVKLDVSLTGTAGPGP